jgi:general secretion pathway protein I
VTVRDAGRLALSRRARAAPVRSLDSPADQRGFSLLEVLVAFSILAICLGGLLRIFGGGARAALLTDEYARGLIVAESLLASVGSEAELVVGRKQGIVAGSIRWEVLVSPIPIQTGNLSEMNFGFVPVSVDVSASWGTDSPRSVRLSTIRLMPARDASNPMNKLPPRRS